MKIWKGFEKGVDLGGWFSQCDYSEERFRNFIREEDFAVIRSWGADHVRIPVDYNLLEEEDGTLRKSGWTHLDRALGYAEKNGLNAVLDLHKTPGFSFDPDEKESGFFDSEKYQERFYRIWERLAARYGKLSDRTAFELLNEVTEERFMPAWNRIARECIRRIRVFAPETRILVGGYWHNSALSVKAIDIPDDTHLVYNFHCYEPLIFTHQGAHWMPSMDPSFRISIGAGFGEMEEASRRMLGAYSAGFDRYPPETVLSAAYFIDYFADAVRAAEKRGVPLYCGEYGVIDLSRPEEALIWYRLIHQAFEHYGIGRAAWSYRQMDFGLSDARMDAVRPELIQYL
ncbi:MAG: cellulase family glycosylhydrolase [Lachnospiraceae bacterium]|nr:cellulase family glycosylhydrolase [Lachnospiraceae bacterium]